MVHRLIWQWIHFLPGTGTNVVRVSMPSRAWVVTDKYHYEINFLPVSMPSRAWVVTYHVCKLSGELAVSMPSWAWVVTICGRKSWYKNVFQCPHGLELLQNTANFAGGHIMFQCPHGLELLRYPLVKRILFWKFQCPHGLELLQQECPIF